MNFVSKFRPTHIPEEEYVAELPVKIREEVMLHIYRDVLKRLALFRWREKYKDCFLAYVLNLLQPMVGWC